MKESNNIPTPSMIEAPFLWTLGVLGLIPVYKEEWVTYTRKLGIWPFKKEEEYQVLENLPVNTKTDGKKIFYYSKKQ